MVITEILARNAGMYGDEIALVERDPGKGTRTTLTWKEFDVMANRVANGLIAKGVKQGDKVIHLMMNCLEWLPAYFGILRTGAWAVPLNFRFTAEDIGYCADIVEAKTMVFGEEFIGRIDDIKENLKTINDFIFVGPDNLKPSYAESFVDFLETSSPDDPGKEINLMDEAALYFTSGTTGTPKPILLTHRNLETACITENRHHNQTREDTFLCIPPLYHTGAKMHWFGSFIVGGKGVILKGIKPEWILEAVSEEEATIVWLLVPWAQDILIAIENDDVNLDDYKLDQWRLMHIGAQPVPPSLIRNWKKVFPSHDYDTNYGLSETTGPGCVHLGMENLHKVGAIGVPGFDWECRIVDFNLKEVPKGDPGELMVKGPGVMKEYYKNPEATQSTLMDGWLLTGDMARFDEDGFIWLVDRKKDVIITGGENIFPVEIEAYLMENQNLQDVAVIGIPDERLGEIVAAVLKVKPGASLSEEEAFNFCEGLPRYKRPRKIFFDEVPRNPTGKIEKPKLRKKYAGMAESFKLQPLTQPLIRNHSEEKMHKLLTDSPGEKMLLLGNEAIARGALEAGVSFATCYPGTPSSEIPMNFFSISQESDLYFEYSTNEKVSMEVAAAAAVSGLRTIVTLKHVGLNVAADPLMTLAYVGIKGGMVIINADDPSLFSSQNEQDNRYFARLSGLPMLEPTTSQEMKDMTLTAFEMSEALELPVIIRTTTRLAHVRGAVELGDLKPITKKATFEKNPFRFVTVPAVSRKLHKVLLEKIDKATEISDSDSYNEVIGTGKWGIVANGACFNYVKDAVSDLGIGDNVSILKLVMSYPLPGTRCIDFMKKMDKVLVVEELEPINETELKAMAQENGITIPIKGKGVGAFSRLFEYDPGMVRQAIADYFSIEYKTPVQLDISGTPDLPARPPNLCAGCPHRATYYAVKQVYGPDAIFPTDIGCYTLGVLPPISMADFVICMGSSVSSSCGFAQATDQKVVSFIGDSTFFHSGITGLVDAVHNNHKFTLVILDNGTTAMTGHQIHPGVNTEPMGIERTRISIEAVVRGVGVQDVHVIKPFKLKKAMESVKKAMEYDGISVIISEELCPLFAKATKQFKKTKPFRINHDKCKNHRHCINLLACPAMYLEGDQVEIDKIACIGCTVCAQVCPENAIVPVKEGQEALK